MTNYQQAKSNLKEVAMRQKRILKNDKPAIRQIINEEAYFLSIDFNLTEYQKNLLHNYACKLHPK